MKNIFAELGISDEVYAIGERINERLAERFEKIDRMAELNAAKVLHAMQKNRVSAACFAGTTGYGYDDIGRDTLEKVYADVFHTEAALAEQTANMKAALVENEAPDLGQTHIEKEYPSRAGGMLNLIKNAENLIKR